MLSGSLVRCLLVKGHSAYIIRRDGTRARARARPLCVEGLDYVDEAEGQEGDSAANGYYVTC